MKGSYTMPHKDLAAKRAYHKAWKVRNRAHVNAYGRSYRAANSERMHAQEAIRRAANKEKRAAQQKASNSRRRAKMKAYEQAWRAANKAHLRVTKAAWRAANLDKTRAAVNRWAATHKDQIKRKDILWSRANPDKLKAKHARRRARHKNAPINDLTHAQWEEIKTAYNHCCVYCGRHMERLTQDHLTPLSKGGSHTKHNVVPACRSCNSKKNTGSVLRPVQPLLL
jgi:HNH endonuclease